MRSTPLDRDMRDALKACAKTPDRLFAAIAAEFGVDREDLQERYLDLVNTGKQKENHSDAHHRYA